MGRCAKKYGIRYSLTLHDREGDRLLGFDNAHEISYGCVFRPNLTTDSGHIRPLNPIVSDHRFRSI